VIKQHDLKGLPGAVEQPGQQPAAACRTDRDAASCSILSSRRSRTLSSSHR
jgi:hypothetical protein